jgi:hypothetical protein
MRKPLLLAMTIGLLLPILSGCDDDERQEVNRSRAQVAEASRQLVQADAKARGEVVALQRDLQQGQADLGRQRDQLENDRRQYADQRIRDPILANTILDVGMILACLLPLALCIFLVLGLRDHSQTDSALTEILVEEIAGESPVLLPSTSRSSALEHEPGTEGLPELPRSDAA